jgi:hypothetical protein
MLIVGLAVGTGHRFSARSMPTRDSTCSSMSSSRGVKSLASTSRPGSQRQGHVLVIATIGELRTAITARSSTRLAASRALASAGAWLCDRCGGPAPRARRGLDARRSFTEACLPRLDVD